MYIKVAKRRNWVLSMQARTRSANAHLPHATNDPEWKTARKRIKARCWAQNSILTTVGPLI